MSLYSNGLKLALRFSGALEKVTTGMSDIGKMLPRFEAYQNLLSNASRLDSALVDLYESIVEFSVESFRFLRQSPLSMT